MTPAELEPLTAGVADCRRDRHRGVTPEYPAVDDCRMSLRMFQASDRFAPALADAAARSSWRAFAHAQRAQREQRQDGQQADGHDENGHQHFDQRDAATASHAGFSVSGGGVYPRLEAMPPSSALACTCRRRGRPWRTYGSLLDSDRPAVPRPDSTLMSPVRTCTDTITGWPDDGAAATGRAATATPCRRQCPGPSGRRTGRKRSPPPRRRWGCWNRSGCAAAGSGTTRALVRPVAGRRCCR